MKSLIDVEIARVPGVSNGPRQQKPLPRPWEAVVPFGPTSDPWQTIPSE